MNIVLLSLIGSVVSHSWLDCIGKAEQEYNGPEQYFSDDFYHQFCIGFPRAYPGRMNQNINTLFTYQVNNRGGPNHDADVCATQDHAYTSQFPMTKVKAGTNLKLWYEMDNHYQPLTQFHLFGHGQPNKPMIKYNEMSEKTELMSHDFATTSNCMNVKNVNTFCWAYWKVPDNWQPGTYSFLWNWRWDRNPSGEEYNSCFDIEVLPGSAHPTEVSPAPSETSSYPSNSTSPIDSTPANPAPTNPSPVDPAPVNPSPVDPAPVNPSPVDPAPVNPVEGIDGANPSSPPTSPETPSKPHYKCRRKPHSLV